MPIGTRNMVADSEKDSKKLQKRFSTTEICRIIKLCRKNEVSELKLGDFEVTFQRKLKKVSKKAEKVDDTVPVNTSLPTREDLKQVERSFGVQDRQTLKELEAAQLLIDDPVAFEEEEIDAAMQGPHMVTVNEDERHW